MTISTFILAIALVETGNNPAAIGRAGERSEYQFRRATWECYTALPFDEKHTRDRKFTRTIATRHADSLQRASRHLTTEHDRVFFCAAAWKCGPRVLAWKQTKEQLSPATRDYADRVWSMYQDLKRKESHGK